MMRPFLSRIDVTCGVAENGRWRDRKRRNRLLVTAFFRRVTVTVYQPSPKDHPSTQCEYAKVPEPNEQNELKNRVTYGNKRSAAIDTRNDRTCQHQQSRRNLCSRNEFADPPHSEVVISAGLFRFHKHLGTLPKNQRGEH